MIEVKPAGKKGRGVFATTNIPKGTVIELAHYIAIPSEDFEDIQNTVIQYYWYYVSGDKEKPNCAIALGTASLYNHSKKPNAEWKILPRRKMIRIKAIRDIRKGQEITIDYGYEVK